MYLGVETMIYNSLGAIAAAFASPEIKVISFDVFDTLLIRPVNSETVKFGLLNKTFRRLTGANIGFARIRAMAEATFRRKILRGELSVEDIPLRMIYDGMMQEFGISREVVDELFREEEALEHRLTAARKSGQYLYKKAIALGKSVIVMTDMYLEKEVILSLLLENGYPEPLRIFVSSDTGARKSTGAMFDLVVEELGVQPGEIFHIGDNLEADIKFAEKKGFRAAWLPGPLDAFKQYGCARQPEKMCRDLTDWEKAKCEPGIGIFRQMAANRYFDDPFRPFDKDSDYNKDPFFVGYAALGPEILALVRWLIDNMRRDGVKKILFLSRDGYLPMQAYQLLRERDETLPECGYLYTSRIALLPAMIRTPLDLYELPVDITRHTPEALWRILSFCCDPAECEAKTKRHTNRLYSLGKAFTSESFQAFVGDFIQLFYDETKHRKSLERIRQYLLYNRTGCLEEGCAVFDMGYSGRIAQALRFSSGIKVPVYYFHADGNRHFLCEAQESFRIRTFLDFSPYMEGTMREYAYLEPVPSCIGYSDDRMPLFDCGPAENYKENAEAMQRGALEFMQDYLEYFRGYEEETAFRYHNAAIPFEAFLLHCSEADREIYRRVEIDDELWGGRRNINLASLMEARLRKLPDYVENREKQRAENK